LPASGRINEDGREARRIVVPAICHIQGRQGMTVAGISDLRTQREYIQAAFAARMSWG